MNWRRVQVHGSGLYRTSCFFLTRHDFQDHGCSFLTLFLALSHSTLYLSDTKTRKWSQSLNLEILSESQNYQQLLWLMRLVLQLWPFPVEQRAWVELSVSTKQIISLACVSCFDSAADHPDKFTIRTELIDHLVLCCARMGAEVIRLSTSSLVCFDLKQNQTWSFSLLLILVVTSFMLHSSKFSTFSLIFVLNLGDFFVFVHKMTSVLTAHELS